MRISYCKYGIIVLLLLVAIAYSAHRLRLHRGKAYRFAVFNTDAVISLWGRPDAELDKAFQEILHELQSLHNTINVYDAASELSSLNVKASQEPFVCSESLWRMICAVRGAHGLTEGAFDPTIGAAMKLWGFHRKRETLPTEGEIAEVKAKVGLEKVLFDDEAHSVRFTAPGMSLDFGGIAKGYAADLAKAILDARGIDMYMIDLGGNLLLSEKVPEGRKGFSVSIRDPNDKGSAARVLELKGCAVATSGNYERSRIIQGMKIGHIMEPITCRPVVQFESVTAITRKGVHSDAFSTAVFVRGEKLAEQLRKSVPYTDFVIIGTAGTAVP